MVVNQSWFVIQPFLYRYICFIFLTKTELEKKRYQYLHRHYGERQRETYVTTFVTLVLVLHGIKESAITLCKHCAHVRPDASHSMEQNDKVEYISIKKTHSSEFLITLYLVAVSESISYLMNRPLSGMVCCIKAGPVNNKAEFNLEDWNSGVAYWTLKLLLGSMKNVTVHW